MADSPSVNGSESLVCAASLSSGSSKSRGLQTPNFGLMARFPGSKTPSSLGINQESGGDRPKEKRRKQQRKKNERRHFLKQKAKSLRPEADKLRALLEIATTRMRAMEGLMGRSLSDEQLVSLVRGVLHDQDAASTGTLSGSKSSKVHHELPSQDLVLVLMTLLLQQRSASAVALAPTTARTPVPAIVVAEHLGNTVKCESDSCALVAMEQCLSDSRDESGLTSTTNEGSECGVAKPNEKVDFEVGTDGVEITIEQLHTMISIIRNAEDEESSFLSNASTLVDASFDDKDTSTFEDAFEQLIDLIPFPSVPEGWHDSALEPLDEESSDSDSYDDDGTFDEHSSVDDNAESTNLTSTENTSHDNLLIEQGKMKTSPTSIFSNIFCSDSKSCQAEESATIETVSDTGTDTSILASISKMLASSFAVSEITDGKHDSASIIDMREDCPLDCNGDGSTPYENSGKAAKEENENDDVLSDMDKNSIELTDEQARSSRLDNLIFGILERTVENELESTSFDYSDGSLNSLDEDQLLFHEGAKFDHDEMILIESSLPVQNKRIGLKSAKVSFINPCGTGDSAPRDRKMPLKAIFTRNLTPLNEHPNSQCHPSISTRQARTAKVERIAAAVTKAHSKREVLSDSNDSDAAQVLKENDHLDEKESSQSVKIVFSPESDYKEEGEPNFSNKARESSRQESQNTHSASATRQILNDSTEGAWDRLESPLEEFSKVIARASSQQDETKESVTNQVMKTGVKDDISGGPSGRASGLATTIDFVSPRKADRNGSFESPAVVKSKGEMSRSEVPLDESQRIVKAAELTPLTTVMTEKACVERELNDSTEGSWERLEISLEETTRRKEKAEQPDFSTKLQSGYSRLRQSNCTEAARDGSKSLFQTAERQSLAPTNIKSPNTSSQQCLSDSTEEAWNRLEFPLDETKSTESERESATHCNLEASDGDAEQAVIDSVRGKCDPYECHLKKAKDIVATAQPESFKPPTRDGFSAWRSLRARQSICKAKEHTADKHQPLQRYSSGPHVKVSVITNCDSYETLEKKSPTFRELRITMTEQQDSAVTKITTSVAKVALCCEKVSTSQAEDRELNFDEPKLRAVEQPAQNGASTYVENKAYSERDKEWYLEYMDEISDAVSRKETSQKLPANNLGCITSWSSTTSPNPLLKKTNTDLVADSIQPKRAASKSPNDVWESFSNSPFEQSSDVERMDSLSHASTTDIIKGVLRHSSDDISYLKGKETCRKEVNSILRPSAKCNRNMNPNHKKNLLRNADVGFPHPTPPRSNVSVKPEWHVSTPEKKIEAQSFESIVSGRARGALDGHELSTHSSKRHSQSTVATAVKTKKFFNVPNEYFGQEYGDHAGFENNTSFPPF